MAAKLAAYYSQKNSGGFASNLQRSSDLLLIFFINNDFNNLM
jgi:hypothetical protein